jgi:cytochrome b561
VALHWVIAILIFATALLVMGGEDEGRRQGGMTLAGFPILGVHMILGITVLVLLVVRLILRWRTRRPAWAATGSALLDRVGELTHWALYFFTFAITITGIVLALQTNRFARAFRLGGTAPRQFTPGRFPPGGFQPGQFPPGGFEGRFPRGGGFFLGAFHGLSWTLLLLLVLLHVGAALYHQFILKDNLFGRMWFGRQYG